MHCCPSVRQSANIYWCGCVNNVNLISRDYSSHFIQLIVTAHLQDIFYLIEPRMPAWERMHASKPTLLSERVPLQEALQRSLHEVLEEVNRINLRFRIIPIEQLVKIVFIKHMNL